MEIKVAVCKRFPYQIGLLHHHNMVSVDCVAEIGKPDKIHTVCLHFINVLNKVFSLLKYVGICPEETDSARRERDGRKHTARRTAGNQTLTFQLQINSVATVPSVQSTLMLP